LKKRAMCAAICCILAISTYGAALGDPLSDKLNSQKQQLQQDQGSLNKVQQQRQSLEDSVEKLDNQIEGLLNQVKGINKQIARTQKDIKAAQKDIDKSESDIKDEQDLFDQRMRAMYINGVDSYIEVLLQSKGFSDFISRAETVKKIADYDKKLIADMEEKKQVIEKKKEALDAQNTKLLSLKADAEQKLAKVNEDKDAQGKLLAQLKTQERRYASRLSASQASVNATMRQISAIRRAAPSYSSSRGSAPISSNSIVAYASNFLGTQYEWGGNGPGTFDCSGFVKYVYAHFGVSLPRVASDQQQVGQAVSSGELQPGDLVFFGYPAHHVGIYVGNNCFIHAPHTGDVVKISSLSDMSDFSGGERIR
jgi:peptidoglycan DL-endopeptidase CwlO